MLKSKNAEGRSLTSKIKIHKSAIANLNLTQLHRLLVFKDSS